MSEEYTLVRDIICEHNERMLNIKKYYPYFKLSEISFSQYKDGRYERLDMGYIMMAVLRFFIEKNNFEESPVFYDMYAEFMHDIFIRDFELELDVEEEKELTGYIFDKIRNDGKPFSYEYFDPEDKKRKVIRTRLIDNKISEDKILYYLTEDAVSFYLDTKEIKEESSISTSQILLYKMITTRNFKGGTEVVARINNEVSRLIARKNEILSVLGRDVFSGVKMFEEFMQNTVKWFDEEQKLFEKNKELTKKALKTYESEEGSYPVMEDIYRLERELNVAMNKHGELLGACMSLQSRIDEIIMKAKLNRLRPIFDFRKALSELIVNERADKLEAFIIPLLKPRIKKSFSLTMLDNMLTCRVEDVGRGEHESERNYQERKYPDELEEERIYHNYCGLTELLFKTIIDRDSFTLAEFNQIIEEKLGRNVMKNGDYYSFFVHLCGKKEYDICETLKKPDTFLEEIIVKRFRENEDEMKKYKYLSFELILGNDKITVENNEMTDITFRRR